LGNFNYFDPFDFLFESYIVRWDKMRVRHDTFSVFFFFFL